MTTPRLLTNRQMRQRLYCNRRRVIYAHLRTPGGEVTVTISVQAAICILHELGSDAICPCRLYVQAGVGYLVPVADDPPTYPAKRNPTTQSMVQGAEFSAATEPNL
jgi:hypothetical protein